MNIRKDDIVEVITGDDRTRDAKKTRVTARVLRVITDTGKVVVEGINKVYRHMKPSRRNQQGGRLSKEMPVDVSKVQLFCGKCRRGVRVGKRVTPAGQKERFCKKCGTAMGNIGKAKPTKV